MSCELAVREAFKPVSVSFLVLSQNNGSVSEQDFFPQGLSWSELSKEQFTTSDCASVSTSRILSLGLDLLYLSHSYLQLLRLQKTRLQDSYLATVTAALTKELETSRHISIRAEAHLTTGGIDLLELSSVMLLFVRGLQGEH